MTINDTIKDEEKQYDMNREKAKISALSWGKIDKYEYLTGEETLLSNQRQIMEQAKFRYSPSVKTFQKKKKKRKLIKEQGEKQKKALENSVDKKFYSEQKSIASLFAKDILKKLQKWEMNLKEMIWFIKQVTRKKLKYMFFRSLKYYDIFEEKFITMVFH